MPNLRSGNFAGNPHSRPIPGKGCAKPGNPVPAAPSPHPRSLPSRPAPQSEDCLYLNVWTASGDTEEKRPVMFWIHGGGSTTGSGGDLIYSGAQLANLGVVVVTINYRLGPLGFMAHPLLSKESEKGVSGNYGFLDQIEALKWVKKNIKAFGGDPDRVTIFGESAGRNRRDPADGLPFGQGIVSSGHLRKRRSLWTEQAIKRGYAES